jgi:predicted  nucleic acid-binding Zn-ribbon protein
MTTLAEHQTTQRNAHAIMREHRIISSRLDEIEDEIADLECERSRLQEQMDDLENDYRQLTNSATLPGANEADLDGTRYRVRTLPLWDGSGVAEVYLPIAGDE